MSDDDEARVEALEGLRREDPKRVRIYPGDFNNRVRDILRPDVVPRTRATFCLLDQRTFECEWRTLEALAEYKACSPAHR